MKNRTHILHITFCLSCLTLAATEALGQIRLDAIGGFAYNIPTYQIGEGAQSPDLYGNGIGGYAGLRLEYGLTTRFYIASELCYQTLPYTIKSLSGQLYPGYTTLSILPAYAIFPKVSVEAGIGGGLTIVSRFADQANNDPLFLGSLGLKIPLGKFGIHARYYHFLRPLYRQTTARGEAIFGGNGIQVGASYDFFK